MPRSLFRLAALASLWALGACAPALAQEGIGPDYLYVAVQGEAAVAVVDMDAMEEVARVDLTALGFSANASPHHVAVDPDGSHWYVSLIAENRVLRFDRGNQLVGQATFEVPGLLARDPASARLYVGRSMMAVNPPRSIGEIDTRTMQVEEADVFFPRPHALEVAPALGRIYSASLSQNQMGVLDQESLGLELLNLDGPIHTLVQFAVSPDGGFLVATAEITGQLLVFDLADPDRPAPVASIPVGSRPWHPVFEPGTSRVWFGLKGENAVVAVDLATREVVARIAHPALVGPHGAAVSLDGRHLFVSSNGPGVTHTMAGADAADHAAMDHAAMDHAADDEAPEAGTLVVIDLSTREVVKVLDMGQNTTGIGTRRP
jgi:DNA-binding beta-propeller fold protein YncE